MKKLLTILLILLPLASYAQQPEDNLPDCIQLARMNVITVGGGVTVAAEDNCCDTGSYCENFEGPGYCTEVSETVGESNSLDPDNTTQKIDSYALQMVVGNAANDCYAVVDIANRSSADMYYSISVFATDGFGSEWVGVTFFGIDSDTTPDTSTAMLFFSATDIGETFRLERNGSNMAQANSDPLAFNTWHTLKVHVPADSGTTDVEWCVNDDLRTGDTNAANINETHAFFGYANAGFYTTGTLYLDNFIQSSNAVDIGWASCE